MTTLAKGEACAGPFKQYVFPGVAYPPDAKTGSAGNTVDQNRLKPCRGRPFGLHAELKSESKKEIPVYFC